MNLKTILYLRLSASAALLLVAAPAAQAQFSYSTNAGTITINGYTGSGGALTIPPRINGLPVTSIGNSAFVSLTSLTKVTIPDTVTSLGEDAFEYCRDLISVYFQGNAPAADATVFSGDNIATVYYAYGTTGWSNTFAGRPAVLENGGEAQFDCITNHGTITITGYSGPDVVIIPSTINGRQVTRVGNNAFTNLTSVASVTIPDSVTSIGDSAFAYCTGLTNVTIPDSVTKLGENVFFDSGLTSVTIPDSIIIIPVGAFAYCASLTSVTIPASVTNIQTSAFAYCSGLIDVTIPASVTNIGASAFTYCGGLTNITIPASVRSINESAFAYCTSLAVATLADGVTNIGAEAFGYCSNLARVAIPVSVTNIGQYAFYECRSLPSVTIPHRVRTIGPDAFGYCSNLASVTISNGVTNIGVSAFYFCTSLTNVTIPGSVRAIGGDAFEYCGSLASVTISNDVRSIGEDAFGYCGSLSNVTIPVSVTNIGAFAFYACSSLPSIIIPHNVRTIQDDAFAYCTSLASVTISNGVHGIGEDAFYACSSLANITIPASITNVGVSAFYSCSNLASVTIPSNVRSIGDDAFAYCVNLSNLTISNGVHSIGEYAFYGCSNLADITIPASVRKIGEWAFADCANLNSVYFGGNVLALDSTVFSADSSAAVYYFPDTAGWSNTFAGLPAYTVALQVTLFPAAAITAGAQWRVDGGSWQNSGASLGNLSVGNHTLDFSTLAGWTAPTNQTVAIKAKAVTKAKGTYIFNAQGTYNGLFMQADATADTSGMLSGLVVTPTGSYSGKLLTAAGANAISGSFDVSGRARNYIARSAGQGGPLTLEMSLNWNNSPPDVSGAVFASNGGWKAGLTSELAIEGSNSAQSTAWMLTKGASSECGCMLMTHSGSTLALSVRLADGTSFSQAVPLSGTGDLPVYGNLYGGRGLLLGWIGLRSGSLSGNLAWIKPASRSAGVYVNGFTNLISVQGSLGTSPSPKP